MFASFSRVGFALPVAASVDRGDMCKTAKDLFTFANACEITDLLVVCCFDANAATRVAEVKVKVKKKRKE